MGQRHIQGVNQDSSRSATRQRHLQRPLHPAPSISFQTYQCNWSQSSQEIKRQPTHFLMPPPGGPPDHPFHKHRIDNGIYTYLWQLDIAPIGGFRRVEWQVYHQVDQWSRQSQVREPAR
ncbi:hypothetical protein PAXRUDRAFT_827409 [Paxillus rubicundulus Ve08.2h10]|uniref:Uncharacterized protein n=1 Tax=Paxillus rubicundulus Ve08.2h10 TaxID=930991 RepID=A0A0D0DQV2_9AGAM|nr:hypothetical protein PAXRUDRAFT_827409 [Paxillus rubicundulus Ve08.2h10]